METGDHDVRKVTIFHKAAFSHVSPYMGLSSLQFLSQGINTLDQYGLVQLFGRDVEADKRLIMRPFH